MATSTLLDRALYRARQLRRTLRPRVKPADLRAARERLGPGLSPLFESMLEADQRHCLDVYYGLLGRGVSDGDMLTAALIHDAGKGRLSGADVRTWHRVAWVVLSNAPAGVRDAATARGGLRVMRDHGPLTVALAREYGAPAGVITLLEEMEGLRTPDERGELLCAVDDEC